MAAGGGEWRVEESSRWRRAVVRHGGWRRAAGGGEQRVEESGGWRRAVDGGGWWLDTAAGRHGGG